MAKVKKQPLNERLAAILETAKPANPTLSSTDRTHLIKLKKRGFTDDEIIAIAAKAGLKVTAEILTVKPRVSKAEKAQAEAAKAKTLMR